MASSGQQLRAAGLVIYRYLQTKGYPEYLILQTSYGSHHWTPPKGHVDPGESDLQTALRETEEEAGYKEQDLNLSSIKKTLHYDVRGVPKTVVYWLAELKEYNNPVRLSQEHQDFKWLGFGEARDFLHSNMIDVLRDIDRGLRDHLNTRHK
ncbi:bis(5'-nucleosyl)-tetraphosphatase [asymmetrical]-like [Actinia tenebrosa]|uniref:Bis(5'-nucleosyl)-tetraphosphatase [asymmetrical] n=1 Tax=Actinia tenebrosa TaxID=6105 RepID=A0A6P8I8Z3_ACTTE|nr:bis(5'-nucleosyl)-tetraphosphatase [asymmetrical]-like [Actinia tenebrosa]